MDIEEVRADIPALESTTYLNWGASGPSPRSVVDAATHALHQHEFDSPQSEGMYPVGFGVLDDARDSIASFLGARESDVALTTSTMDGIARVAASMEWEAGDTVVRTDVEHPAGILPWQRLADTRGIDIRVVPTDDGRLDMEALQSAVTDATLVAISAVSWTNGVIFPVREVVDIAHDAGAKVLIDAVQAPGQMPVDVEDWGADYVAGAGHKWLIAPWGAGFLYANTDAAGALEPPVATYMGVEEPTADAYQFHPDVRRLELGTLSPAPHAGLKEAISLLEDLGIDSIQSRIDDLTDRLLDGIPADQVYGPPDPETGLVSFRVSDADKAVTAMAEENVVIRSIPVDEEVVRVSVHAYNTTDEMDQIRDGLRSLRP